MKHQIEGRSPDVWEKKAAEFGDIYKGVRSNRVVHDAMVKKTSAALQVWAIVKMGKNRDKYLRDALDVFYVMIALNAAQSGKSLEQAAEECPLQFRLSLSKKRAGFIERIPEFVSYMKEYEAVRRVVESAKSNAASNGHFRLLLRETLPKPLPRQFEKKLQSYFFKNTKPSAVAQDYVGCVHGVSPAAVKKFVDLARHEKHVFPKLYQELLKSYLANPAKL